MCIASGRGLARSNAPQGLWSGFRLGSGDLPGNSRGLSGYQPGVGSVPDRSRDIETPLPPIQVAFTTSFSHAGTMLQTKPRC